MSLAAGDKLGAREILGAVGAGGMGEVYRARDPRLGREVAFMVLPPAAAGSRPVGAGRRAGRAPRRDPPDRPAHRGGVRADRRRGRDVILDTDAVSALADGTRAVLDAAGEVDRLSLPVIVLGEFRFGAAHSRHRARYESWLARLAAASHVLVIDEETARHYAALRERLRAAGRPIPSNDAWIAALALQHRLPLLSRDRHFDTVVGVRRVEW